MTAEQLPGRSQESCGCALEYVQRHYRSSLKVQLVDQSGLSLGESRTTVPDLLGKNERMESTRHIHSEDRCEPADESFDNTADIYECLYLLTSSKRKVVHLDRDRYDRSGATTAHVFMFSKFCWYRPHPLSVEERWNWSDFLKEVCGHPVSLDRASTATNRRYRLLPLIDPETWIDFTWRKPARRERIDQTR